ncbi:MAG: hypothetical protein JKY42_02530 [Flavobacteriales bacterium]|nr:hypothetical protein [Flavobacteriales bacterium]
MKKKLRWQMSYWIAGEMKYSKLWIYGLSILTIALLVLVAFFLSIDDDYQIEDKNWLVALPDCPCEVPDLKNTSDGWAYDIRSSVERFHIGAKYNFRSYPAIETTQGNSCQQCCYDANGKLIATGPGAGTPDRESSCAGENENGEMGVNYANIGFHVVKDVLPFFRMKIENYHLQWEPNKGENCD